MDLASRAICLYSFRVRTPSSFYLSSDHLHESNYPYHDPWLYLKSLAVMDPTAVISSEEATLKVQYQLLSEFLQEEQDGSSPSPSTAPSTPSMSSAMFSARSSMSSISAVAFTYDLDDISPMSTSLRTTPGSPLLNAHHAVSSPVSTTALFFKKLPLEMRREIYKHVLFNPLLGQTDAIVPQLNSGATQSYELSPALLQVSKQMYEEASDALYGSNTFIVSCLGQGDDEYELDTARLVQCPLTRYRYSGSYVTLDAFVKKSQFKKVRNWRIMISNFAGKNRLSLEFQDFCRVLSKTVPKSVTVLSLSQDFCRHWKPPLYYGAPSVRTEPFAILEVLAPLRVLRNLKELRFEALGVEEVAYDLQLEMKAIAESNDPSLINMYDRLLTYTKTFERVYSYRKDMETLRWRHREEQGAHEKPAMDASLRLKPWARRFLNPFKTSAPHFVEKSLELAKYASDENDCEDIKRQRKAILEFLEPQYQRILAAHNLLVSFVETQQGEIGILNDQALYKLGSDYDGEHINEVLDATLLLEDYAKSFDRDLTHDVRKIFRLHQDVITGKYEDLQREQEMCKMDKALKAGDVWQWADSFHSAMGDMEEQFMTMRRARAHIFDFDGPEIVDRGCDIDVKADSGDDSIDEAVEGDPFYDYDTDSDSDDGRKEARLWDLY